MITLFTFYLYITGVQLNITFKLSLYPVLFHLKASFMVLIIFLWHSSEACLSAVQTETDDNRGHCTSYLGSPVLVLVGQDGRTAASDLAR